jgi:hypothetical protein
MRRAHAVAVDEQEAGIDGVLECERVRDRRELRQAQVGAQRDGEQQPAHGAGQTDHASVQQVLDRLRHRDVGPVFHRRARSERAPDLECEQRVADRRLDDAAHDPPGYRQPEPLGQDPPRRAEAQRADLDARQPSPVEGLLELRRRCRAPGEEECDRFALEPAGGEGKRVGGRRIEPLDVVDCDQQRPAGCQRAERVQEADRDRVHLRRRIRRLGPQQRRFERAQLGNRQHRQLVCVDSVEQVDQSCEGELCLSPARPRREHAQPVLARSPDPGLPERRLADPRSTDEDE